MMRALWLEPPQPPRLIETEVPHHAEECRIRVRLAGICGTDLALTTGYAGFQGVPGHEFVGVVETAPQASSNWVGRRVVGEINVGCGACRRCREGVEGHCARRTVLGIRGRSGAFADFVSLPARNLHAVPEAMADTTAVFVEPVAAACEILSQLAIGPETRVAVLGDGRFGLIIGQVIASANAPVTMLARHPEKLEVARRVGLEGRIDGGSRRPAEEFDVVIEATGRAAGLARALALVRPRGTVVVKSTVPGHVPLALETLVVNEISLVGSRCGLIEPALALLHSGAVRVEPLIARIEPLEQFEEAFASARSALKVLFRVASGS